MARENPTVKEDRMVIENLMETNPTNQGKDLEKTGLLVKENPMVTESRTEKTSLSVREDHTAIGSRMVKAGLLARENLMREDHQGAILIVMEAQNFPGKRKNGQAHQTEGLAEEMTRVATGQGSQGRMAMANSGENTYMRDHHHAQEASFKEDPLKKGKSRTWNMPRSSRLQMK